MVAARRFLAIVILAASPALAQAPLTVDALMADLARTTEASVSFVETRQSSLLKSPLEIRGELFFRRPDRLERRVVSPYAARYVVEGDSVTIEQGDGKPARVPLDAQPALRPFIESIRATLRGDAATLRRFYKVSVTGNATRWRLDLLPSDPSMVEYVASVSIVGGDGKLASMEVVEPNGDRSTTRFTEARR